MFTSFSSFTSFTWWISILAVPHPETPCWAIWQQGSEASQWTIRCPLVAFLQWASLAWPLPAVLHTANQLLKLLNILPGPFYLLHPCGKRLVPLNKCCLLLVTQWIVQTQTHIQLERPDVINICIGCQLQNALYSFLRTEPYSSLDDKYAVGVNLKILSVLVNFQSHAGKV